MKRRICSLAALVAAVAVLASLLAACGGTNTAGETETLLGEIIAADDTSLTIELVEQTENAQAPAGSFAENAGNAPEKPDGTAPQGGSENAGSAPEKPDGTAPQGGSENAGSAPEKPDGTAPQGGQPGGMGGYTKTGESRTLTLSADTEILSDGNSTQTLTVADLTVGSLVKVTVQGDAAQSVTLQNTRPGGMPGGDNADSADSGSQDNGTAATTYDTDTYLPGENYASRSSDENAVRATGGAIVTLTDAAVEKTGDTSSQDSSNFYGMNAGVLAEDGAALNLDGSTVTTDASGANGVFAYGTGTVNVSDTKIRTAKDNSGGIEVAGGGTLYASNLDVQTEGNSAAAIRSDRGGGTETVEGGSYVTNGTGSPAVYSTADVSVSNATLTANHSEAVVVEGENSVLLTDCTVTGAMDGTYGTDSENIHGVMLYQSMSGDAEEGQAQFTMNGGSLTAQTGDLFYVTNTSCVITLNHAELAYDNTCHLLTVAGNDGTNGWGTQGTNGGQVALNATAQTLAGSIAVDAVSTLNMTLSGKSSFTGCVNADNSGAATVAVTLDDTSTWTLTDDCWLTEFNGSTSCITANGHHVYVNGTAIV